MKFPKMMRVLPLSILIGIPLECISALLYVPVVTSFERVNSFTSITNISPQLINVDDNIAGIVNTKGTIGIAWVDKNATGTNYAFRSIVPATGAVSSTYIIGTQQQGETFAEFTTRLYKAGSYNRNITMTWASASSTDYCHGTTYSSVSRMSYGSSVQEAYSSAIGAATLPIQTVCAEIPPAAGYCEIDSSEVKLDFGVMVRSSAVGREVSAPIEITCPVAMKVKLLEPMGGDVVLSNGGMVHIYADGVKINSALPPISIGNGETRRLNISAKLNNAGETGSFNGVTVLSLSYP